VIDVQQDTAKPNGKHFCWQQDRLDKIDADYAKISSMVLVLLRGQQKQNEALVSIASVQDEMSMKLGGPDPLHPLTNTGLIGAVQQVTERQISAELDLRPRIDSLEDDETNATAQSVAELVARAKKAEDELAKVTARQWVLFQRIILIIATGGGVAGLMRVAWEFVK
jgi:hypothetical protein